MPQWPGVPVGAQPQQAPPPPQYPGIIRGRSDPYKDAEEQRKQQDQAMQAEQLRLSQEANARAAAEAQRKQAEFEGQGGKPTESERTAAFLATRVASSSRQLSDAIAMDQSSESPTLGVEAVRGIFGDTAANYVTDEQRQQVRSAQLDLIDAALTLGTGAAYTAEQKETYREAYFPQLGDSAATIADKKVRLRTLLESARIKAGNSAGDIDKAIAAIFPAEQKPEDAPPALTNPPGQAADGRIAGAGFDNGGDGSLGVTQEGYNQVDNPILSGVRQEYLARLGRGDSAQELIQWAQRAGIDRRAFGSIGQQVKFRRENPTVPLSQYDTSELDDMLVPLSGAEQELNRNAQSAVGAGFISAADAASGFTLDNIIGATGGNAERARLGMAQVANEQPVASIIGTVGGGALTALGAEGALAAKGVAAGIPRAMAADATYGAVAGAGGTDYAGDGSQASIADRAVGAAKGVAAGAGGSYLGGRAGNALARAGSPASDASVRAINAEGIPTTIGQQYGRSGKIGEAVKGVEDRLSGLPIVGGVVTGRQREGVRTFNARAFDKALEPIGGSVSGKVGEDAIASAQQQVSAAFDTALAGKGASPDQVFAQDLSAAVLKAKSIKRLGDEVTDELAEILTPYANDPLLSGEALQDISRQLRELKYAYRADPLAKRVAGAVDATERAVFDLFDRQASGTIPEYMAARRAYRRLSILEDAVLMGKNTEGEFTPAQLGRADRRNAIRYNGKRSAAAGGGEFHDYQRAAQDVLPNKVPDSGTAGRLLLPLLGAGVLGGDAAMGDGVSGTGITIAAILGGAYSKPLQRLMTKPGRGIQAPAISGVLKNPNTKRITGAVGAMSAIGTTNQQ